MVAPRGERAKDEVSVMRFFDTNILVYAVDPRDGRKQRIAMELLSHAMDVNHDGAISVQVLSEFANILRNKFHLPEERVEEYLAFFYPLLMTEVTADMVRSALYIEKEYGIQYYDSLIVAAAEKLGCHEIVSEDFNAGQLYRGMVAVNPFYRQIT